jgi:hypothetical protein
MIHESVELRRVVNGITPQSKRLRLSKSEDERGADFVHG